MLQKPPRRTKSITAKVTEAEHRQLQDFALDHGQTISELARELLLCKLQGDHEAQTLLSEVLALRSILLNVSFALSRSEPLSSERMRELTTRADADKLNKAKERLAITIQPRPGISAQETKKEKL